MAGKRVLIVDDAVFQSELLKEVFDNEFKADIEVFIAKDYKSAEEVIFDNDIDLILVDYLLGAAGTGSDLKQVIDKSHEGRFIWVLMSALDVDALKEQHGRAGFTSFVHKSDYNEITQEIKRVLF